MNHVTTAYQQYLAKKSRLEEEAKKHFPKRDSIPVISKPTSNLFRKQKKLRQPSLPIRDFNSIISIDNQKLVAQVEGMTTYEKLVEHTLAYDCLPTIVPELKTITIGGAYSGCGIESSSFRYGLVHETIMEADVLIGDGSVLTCNSHNDYSDLFYAFPNSYGTLGYALRVVTKLIPIKRYIKLSRSRFKDQRNFFSALEEFCYKYRNSENHYYLDAVIFNENEFYINLGELVDEAPYLSCYNYENIYYKSIQEYTEDYLSIKDYMWRWDTDWFWCSKVFFMQNHLLRKLFGRWLLGSKVYTQLMHFATRHPVVSSIHTYLRGQRESIIQDILIPADKANVFFDFYKKNISLFPVWICPSQSYSSTASFDLCPLDPTQLYFDFGFWDSKPTKESPGFYNRKIEQVTNELGGFKSLYSENYYSNEEFWNIYDEKKYKYLKKKYDPQEIFGDLYSKCHS